MRSRETSDDSLPWFDIESDLITTLFIISGLVIVGILPVAIIGSIISGLPTASIITILTPVGLLLVVVLLAVLFNGLLDVQHSQLEVLQEQSQWAKASNAPAVVINNWSVEGNTVLFRLQNHGNSFVERMELLADLQILDQSDEIVETYRGISSLENPNASGFRAQFLPVTTEGEKGGRTSFRTEVIFDEATASSNSDVPRLESILENLTENTESMVRAELTLTLRIVAPGGNTEEREFWTSRVGVFEGKTVEELIYGSKQRWVPHHIAPRGWGQKR